MCLFCSIISGAEHGYFVYRDNDISAILDKYPSSPGHTLVMPNRHYNDLLVTEPSLLSPLVRKTVFIAKSIKEVLNADGVRILTNIGRSSGQVIFHTHIHIIPSWEVLPSVFSTFEPRRLQEQSYYESLQKVISQYIKTSSEKEIN
ncbi:HIT domain-containing protein [Metallosphaera hakonensis]|uniref:HIT domain-containing protein n=1 Tax=Metallosphaera hakonensis JCM 8857 = DSM 7519 TaxID=1293036 RepID=A0A2U9ISH2_9CREN|nr:HIT domain-containing protein [Metallosphaera hakonensis]AWR98893.1 HIT domain-containing protein [Metallosphaera hakonensis JCM 8857 = DSM 7519]